MYKHEVPKYEKKNLLFGLTKSDKKTSTTRTEGKNSPMTWCSLNVFHDPDPL